jgi:phosphoribosylformylglycinamidine synthase subunit PurL
VTLAESCLAGEAGVRFVPEADADPAQLLFSEAPGRVVVSVAPEDLDSLLSLAAEHDVDVREAGEVVRGAGGGDRLEIAGIVDLDLGGVRAAYENALARLLEPDPLT